MSAIIQSLLILVAAIAMLNLDDYVVERGLMRDLVGHDRRPASFLVYLWLTSEQARRRGAVQVSYQEHGRVPLDCREVQPKPAVSWLVRRKLLTASKENATAIPSYTVRSPWGILHGASASAAISDCSFRITGTREKCKCCRRRHSQGYPLARDSRPIIRPGHSSATT